MPSTGASALALRQASPSLLFCSVSLRPCTFAVYPSHLCQARADHRFGVGGPLPKPLHVELSLRCLRAIASCLIASWRLRTQAEGGSPNSSPSRLRMIFGAPEASTIRLVKRNLKRHPSGVRVREDDLKICGFNKRVRPVGEVSLCFCFFRQFD